MASVGDVAKLVLNFRSLKKKNDILESEIERSRRANNYSASDDFTLVGTNKSGSIQAGLNSVRNINDLPAAKLKAEFKIVCPIIGPLCRVS